MKKVLITLTAVLTLMSCSKEEQAQTQEASFSIADDYRLVSIDYLRDGQPFTTEVVCGDTWTFTSEGQYIRNEYNQETCEYRYQVSNTYTATPEVIMIGDTAYSLEQSTGVMSLTKDLSDGLVAVFNLTPM